MTAYYYTPAYYLTESPSGVVWEKVGGAASGRAGSGPARITTAWLPATTGAAVTGTWTSTAAATGQPDGGSAQWSTTGAGTGVLETGGYGAAAAVPAGAPVQDVRVRVRHAESVGITSVTAQVYVGATPVGSAQALVAGTTLHDDEVVVTGITAADLADLRVRVTAVRPS